MCWDSSTATNGTFLAVSPCRNNGTKDVAQQWTINKDSTIRSVANSSLCLTNQYFQSSDRRVYLSECEGNKLQQHYAWHGTAPGQPSVHMFFYSDWGTAIKLVRGS